jgi:outer membrane protein
MPTIYAGDRIVKKRLSLQLMTILAACLCAAGLAHADVHIGVVNPAVLVQKAPQAEAARKRLEHEFAARRHKLQDIKDNLEKESKLLDRNSSVMSSGQLQKKTDELHDKQRHFKQLQSNYNDDVHRREQEEFDKLRKSIYQVIVKVAKERGYDLILSNGIVYATNKIDLTQKVLARLKKDARSGK